MNNFLFIVLTLTIAIPFVVYMSVKLGVYAYHRGKQVFEDEQKKDQST